ncbi:MAG: DUF1670 domain-containing protein [Chloroflexi bacterium]|nr:DUF1670 domain-containing protein [Chloroflexota bacterium]MBU1746161.1 DUF1670 domain-containing protein [Chloroflexota bacterium]
MSPRPHHRHENLAPLRDKTLTNVLCQLFVTQFGYENKVLFAEAMIARILETIETFVKPTELLQPGQLLWMAVVHDGGKHAHCMMKEIPQVPVVLDLVTDQDLQALAANEPFPQVRQQRHARLLDQAFAQGGVLSQNDLAAITLTAKTSVSNDVRRTQQEEERVLPYRGSVQDTGATLTHKVETIRLFEAGHLEPEICRLLPVVHDLQSVENYVQTYKNVLKLLERGFSPREVSGILGVSERLVNAYIAIIREHHPEILTQNPHCQEQPDAPN